MEILIFTMLDDLPLVFFVPSEQTCTVWYEQEENLEHFASRFNIDWDDLAEHVTFATESLDFHSGDGQSLR